MRRAARNRGCEFGRVGDLYEPLSNYLSQALGVSARVQIIAPMGGGTHANLRVSARIDSERRTFVVRRAAPTVDGGFGPGPQSLEAEFRVMKEVGPTGLAPRVWGLDAEGKHLGVPAFIEEYLEGPTVREAAAEDPAVVERFAKAILLMNRVPAATVPSVTARTGEPAATPVPLVEWLAREASKFEVPATFVNGLDELRRTEPANRPRPAFGNGDLDPSNFLVTPGGAIAVIDWEFAGFTDPLAELMQLHGLPDESSFLPEHPVDRIYCQLAGLDPAILRWYELQSALASWVYAAKDVNPRKIQTHLRRMERLLA